MGDSQTDLSKQGANSVGKTRNWLIFSSIGVFASIVFGVLYLFVLAPTIPDGSVGWFLFSFATGLTMIVLPCTLPLAFVIIPLSMGKGMLRGIGMALSFGTGVAVTLSLYGIAAALLGGIAIDALGADLESIKNWVYLIAGIFTLVFALSEIGLMNIHMPSYSGAAPAFIQKRQELLKAFLLGLFLGNVGVGCPHPATPLILIEIASSGDVLYGWLMFLVHAIGRILPLLLLSFLAILGVNGLSWLLARKDAVERTTGWAMVFIAGFILTLGLFSHDWWVNSGIHTGLESLTQEQSFNILINDTLGTEVAHKHGLEDGLGLFGQPLWWGNWFLVFLWIFPMVWWYRKRRRDLEKEPDDCEEKILSVKKNFIIVLSIFIVLTFAYFLPKNFYLASTGEDNMAEDHTSTPGHNESGDHVEEFEEMDMGDENMSENTDSQVINTTESIDLFTEYIDSEPTQRLVILDNTDSAGSVTIVDSGAVEVAAGLTTAEPTGFLETASSTFLFDPEQEDDTSANIGMGEVKEVETNDLGMWSFTLGDLVKINVTNDSSNAVEIHMHGQRFMLLDRVNINELGLSSNMWFDSVSIAMASSTDLLVDMNTIGDWFVHGHAREQISASSSIKFSVSEEIDAQEYVVQVSATDGGEKIVPTKNLAGVEFLFSQKITDDEYTVIPETRFFTGGRRENVIMTFTDTSGNVAALSSDTKEALNVIFVKEDDSISILTYPGNTDLDSMTGDHDDSEEPHALNFINITYADGADHSKDSEVDRSSTSYIVPIVFPAGGVYRAFVAYNIAGESALRMSTFDVEVSEPVFSIDSFGWSDRKQWWILLLTSIALIVPLVWFVKRYLRKELT